MKTILTLLALLMQGLFTYAGNLSIDRLSSTPVHATVPERALVPLLNFQVTGSEVSITGFTMQCVDTLTNHDIGELVLMLDEDHSERGRATISADGHATFNSLFNFTGQKTVNFTVLMRAWSDLRSFNGSTFALMLTTVQSDIPTVGSLPIAGATATLVTTPTIGNIILKPAQRAATGGVFANVSGQELGAFSATVWQNEDIACHRMSFMIEGAPVVTNLTVVDNNGNTVAGAESSSWYGEKSGLTTVTFTNTFAFPRGTSTYHIYGQLAPIGINGSWIQVTSSVNLSTWELFGVTSGYRIEPWSGNMDLGTVPINSGRVLIVLSPNGVGSTVPQGGIQSLLCTLSLMTYDSAENESCTKLRVCFSGSGVSTNIGNVQVYLGTNSLNALHPGTIQADGTLNLTLDQPLIIPKDAVFNLAFKGDVSSNALVGSAYGLNICDNNGGGFAFVGSVDGLPPIINVPIQFGTSITVGTTPYPGLVFGNNLTLGSIGYDVLMLQRILGLDETGYFDEATANAVKAYQELHGIPGTGFVGPLTRASLNSNNLLQYTWEIKLSLTKPYWWKSSLKITGRPYTQVIVEKSSDLVSWSQIQTVMIGDIGLATYDDVETGSKQFYRLVPVP